MSRLQISVVLAILAGTWLLSARAQGRPVLTQEFMVAELGAYIARPERLPVQGSEPENSLLAAQATDLGEDGPPAALAEHDMAADPQAQVQILMLTRMD